MATRKKLYRIWNETDKKYESTSRSKSSWTSLSWALQALNSVKFRKHVVLHEFTLENPKVYSPSEASSIVEDKNRKSREAELRKEQKKAELKLKLEKQAAIHYEKYLELLSRSRKL